MNLKDRLNQLTQDATTTKRLEQEEKERQAKAKQEYEDKAQQEAARIINESIEANALIAAANGEKSLVVVKKTDVPYSLSNNQDFHFTKENLPYYLAKGLFNKCMRNYHIIYYVLHTLKLGASLMFEHDGVGKNSWYVLTVKW